MLFSKNKLPITSSKQEQQIITAIRKTMAVIEFTPNGTILTANNAFCELMGYAPQELEHQHHAMFCSPAYTASPKEPLVLRKPHLWYKTLQCRLIY